MSKCPNTFVHIHCIHINKLLFVWNSCYSHLHGPQVYKTLHIGMNTASTNIYERIGHSQELCNF